MVHGAKGRFGRSRTTVGRGTRGATRRAGIVSALAMGAVLVLIGRLAEVQLLHGPQLAQAALAERLRDIPLPATRGEITDRAGHVLAISVPQAVVQADPALIPAQQRPAMAQQLAGILGLPAATLLQSLNGPGQYAILEAGATDAQGRAVSALGLPGVWVTSTWTRRYPDGFFLGSVLGFLNAQGGAAGVELSYQKQLAGVNGSELLQEDAFGNALPLPPLSKIPAKPGLNLELTIDSGLQEDLQQQLEMAVAATGADGAYGLVMKPSTGSILAAATWPTYDPNAYADVSPAVWANTVQGHDLPPGSVFKPITAAAALQAGLVTPDTPFVDPGYLDAGGVFLHDFQALARNTTFQRAFEESANVVFGTVSLRMGASTFYSYLRAFGLMNLPGSDLPGEEPNLFVPISRLQPVDLASEAFGESMSVTPLSLLTALNVVADGGLLIQPHVGRALLNAQGQVVQRIQPVVVRRVVSAQVAATVRQMMVSVVNDGTGERGFIPCYDAGGKTGTSNIYTATGVANRFIASFVGLAPASRPAAIALVMLDDPKGNFNEGGEVAAPVVQQVLSQAMHDLGVAPHCTATNQLPPRTGQPGTTRLTLNMVRMPPLEGLSVQAARTAAAAAGVQLQVTGTGGTVARQNPPAGSMVQQWTTVQGYTQAQALEPPGMVPVPDTLGQTMAQAGAGLTGAGLAMEATGVGTAVSQVPAAGTDVPAGSSVEVEFAPPVSGSGSAAG